MKKTSKKLQSINNKLKNLAAEGDIKNFYRAHNEFHQLFIKSAGNQKLAELIQQLGMKFIRLRMASLSAPGRMDISVAEHERLIEAFKMQDGHLAETLVKQTAAIGGRVLLDMMTKSTAVNA